MNSHPQRSDANNSFCVVHNGIVTNYKELKAFLIRKGYEFESDTDTEIIAKLVHHIYKQHPSYCFRELVEQVIQQLVPTYTIHYSIYYIFYLEYIIIIIIIIHISIFNIICLA